MRVASYSSIEWVDDEVPGSQVEDFCPVSDQAHAAMAAAAGRLAQQVHHLKRNPGTRRLLAPATASHADEGGTRDQQMRGNPHTVGIV